MAKLDIQGGSVGVITEVFIQDSTSTAGAGLANLTATAAGLTAYYALPGLAATAITLATQTATGVFASGGFCAIDNTNMPGFYRLDLLNAMLASTSRSCGAMIKGATNMAQLPLEIQITGWNNQTGAVVSVTGSVGSVTATVSANVVQWAGFTTATTQQAISTTAFTSASNVNVISWAGASTATTQLALSTFVNVTQWAGAPTATTQAAVATTPSVNAIQWAGASTATNQLAVATTLDTGSLSAIWAVQVDGTVTAAQSLRLANSANGGLLSGATTSAVAIRDLANTKNRVLASGDLTGNRLAVTLDLT